MMEFVTILHETPTDIRDFSPEELQKMLAEYMEWTRSIRERDAIVAEKNLDNTTGFVVRGHAADTIVSDGPYAESKEIIGGLHIIRAESYDDALAWARKCPALAYGASVEIRAVESWEGEEPKNV